MIGIPRFPSVRLRRILLGLGFVLAGGSLAATVGAFAPQTQGPGLPPQTPPPQQDPTKTPPPQTNDEIERLRKTIAGNDQSGRSKLLTLDPVAKKTATVNATITFRALARNPSVTSGVVLTYSLNGAPEGAVINPETGVFSWVPTIPGTYTFYIVAIDNSEPPRSVATPVTIQVTQPLTLFGYSFFTSARALIDARLAVVRSGLGTEPSSQANTAHIAAGLPIITQPGKEGLNTLQIHPGMTDNRVPPLSSTSRPANPLTPSTTPSSGGAPSKANSERTGTQTTGQNLPDVQPSLLGSQGRNGTSNPQANVPSGLNSPTNGNSPNADALRYFVGPFDMLGLNVFVPAPERYQLGPGDTLTLRYSSPAVEANEVDLKVDSQGQVTIPIGNRRVVVRGQTLQQAEVAVRRVMRLELRNVQVTLTLKALRTSSITVLGDAYLPGNYQVPAVATLFNALYMFGGPSETGSLRKIELRRTDGTTRTFDMYKFLVYGDSKQDVPLQPGDTIWIPPAGARVTVTGEVARPGIYEAAPGERLRNLIAFAGGPKSTGVVQRVSLQTVEPSVGRQLRDVDLSATGTPEGDPVVFDGDIATVSSVREQFTNAITLEGAVDQPGQYAAVPGTTVADLIGRARGLLPEAYTARADLFRRNLDRSQTLVPIDLERAIARDPAANPVLLPSDRLVVYAVGDVQWMGDRQVSVRGAVQRPGVFYRADNMRVIDLLLQAGGLTPDAYTDEVFLQRTEANGTLGPLVRIDLRRLAAGDAAMNVALQDQDVLVIQTITEARYTPDARVRILGAVQAPGPYPRGSNMRLSDLVKLAGGPLPNASDDVEITNARVPVGTPRTKVSLRAILAGAEDPALQDGDLVTIPSRTDIQLTPRTVYITGAVKQPGPYSVDASTDRISDLVTRAGGFAPNAYPDGAQFFRDPQKLATVSQGRITPRIQKAFEIVDRESYMRALAKSQIDKARLLKSAAGSPGITLPGVGGTGDTPAVQLPASVVEQSTVSPARPLTEEDLQPGGNVNVDLVNALKHRGSSDDVVLQDGDIIVVPEKPTTVSVVGAVTVPSAVLFVPGQSIDFYINRSGGYVTDAARDQVLLIRYKGLVVKPTRGTRVELGDIIWVPTRVMAERFSDKTTEIDTVSRNVFSGAVMLAVLRSLFR